MPSQTRRWARHTQRRTRNTRIAHQTTQQRYSRSYQRLSDRLIEKLPGQEIRTSELTIQPLSKNGKVRADRVDRRNHSLFDTINITGLSYSDGRSLTFSTDERIAVRDSLLEKDPGLNLDEHNKSGHTLIHQIILSAGMDEADKVQMIRLLASRGADVNGLTPGCPFVELALRLSIQQPELVDTLRDSGAKMSLGERIPVLAHLIGAGGEVSLKSDRDSLRVSRLRGSPRATLRMGLIRLLWPHLGELRERTTGPMDELYQRAERGMGEYDEPR